MSKAKYLATTGREQKRDADVLCYQIRQSFKPGEVTPVGANAIGYDLAMRWTKGAHAFFVATHIDRHFVHNHIYYNSTALDCTHKFRDFKGSARALRRLSDRICLENNLSVILDPKQHSQGKFKHYGQWLEAEKKSHAKPVKTPRRKVNLIIDIQQKLREGKGPGYEHWAAPRKRTCARPWPSSTISTPCLRGCNSDWPLRRTQRTVHGSLSSKKSQITFNRSRSGHSLPDSMSL